MRIAENVEMLEIKNDHGALYPVLLWDDKDVILIDTGLPGQFDLIAEAVKEAGFAIEEITKVIITHHDLDHIGSVKRLGALGAEILAHETEALYITGNETSPKLVRMEKRLNELSEDERSFYERIKAGAPNFYVDVDKRLKDGEVLSLCGGIKVIGTPGHTPGHIALLLEKSNIVVAGDAANISDGKLTGANPKHSLDMEKAQESFEKLMDCHGNMVICYHGGRSV